VQKKIFIVVGSKGGGGKTPISIAIGQTLFMYLKRSVAFVDLGFVNPDLRRICINMITEHRPEDRILKEIIYKYGKHDRLLKAYTISSSGLYLITRDEDHIYDPLNYDEISAILKAVLSGINAEYFIVDTNMSILNLKSGFPLLRNLDIPVKLFFVNIWSLSLMKNELEKLYLAGINQILRVNGLSEENIIHVFSPRFIPGTRGILLTLMKLIKSGPMGRGEHFYMLKQLIDIYLFKMKNKPWEPIDSSFIINILTELNQYLLGFKYGAVAQGGKYIVECLFKILSDNIKHWDIFPKNLLINPIIRETLAYFSELYSNTRISVEHMQTYLNEDTPLIKLFVEEAVNHGYI